MIVIVVEIRTKPHLEAVEEAEDKRPWHDTC